MIYNVLFKYFINMDILKIFIRYISVMWLDDDDKEFNNDKEILYF